MAEPTRREAQDRAACDVTGEGPDIENPARQAQMSNLRPVVRAGVRVPEAKWKLSIRRSG